MKEGSDLQALSWHASSRDRPQVSLQDEQRLLGRLVRALCLRRPLMSVLASSWGELLKMTGEGPLPEGLKREIAVGLSLLPFAYANLRSLVCEDILATDASETVGVFCISQGITVSGRSVAAHLEASKEDTKGNFWGKVMLFTHKEGLGGFRRALDLLQVVLVPGA